MTNPYDGTAAVIVPQSVEKLPLYHWRPGARLLTVGSRAGPVFAPELAREEGSTFRRPVTPELLREVLHKVPVDAIAATWCESLWFPQGLATLGAAGTPLIIATTGLGEVEPWLDRVAAWLLLISGPLSPGAERILTAGRHVEVLLGLEGDDRMPRLPGNRVAAVHLVPRTPAADPQERREWYAAIRPQVAGWTVYDEDHPHTDCVCGERLIWRSAGKSRRDALTDAGTCQACRRPWPERASGGMASSPRA